MYSRRTLIRAAGGAALGGLLAGCHADRSQSSTTDDRCPGDEHEGPPHRSTPADELVLAIDFDLDNDFDNDLDDDRRQAVVGG